jgi:hypothetical protein
MSQPLTLQSLSIELDEWRKNRTKQGRLPDNIWTKTLKLLENHSMTEVSRELRISLDRADNIYVTILCCQAQGIVISSCSICSYFRYRQQSINNIYVAIYCCQSQGIVIISCSIICNRVYYQQSIYYIGRPFLAATCKAALSSTAASATASGIACNLFTTSL